MIVKLKKQAEHTIYKICSNKVDTEDSRPLFLQLGVIQEVNGYMLIYAYLVPLEAMNFEAGHDNPLPKQ